MRKKRPIQSQESAGCKTITYAKMGDTGGARGGNGLCNKRGTGKKTGDTSVECSSMARVTSVGWLIIQH